MSSERSWCRAPPMRRSRGICNFERLRFAAPGLDGPDAEAGPSDGAAGAGGGKAGDPHGIPAINFHAAELTLGGRQFGDVRATLLKLDDGVSPATADRDGRQLQCPRPG